MRAALLAGAGLAAAVAVAGIAVAVASRDAPAVGPSTPDVQTVAVTRTTLVDVTVVPGSLGYGPERELASRLTGTVTALPAVGTTVKRGEAAVRVDDRPVVLLYGALPAYRDLAPPQPATGERAEAVPGSSGTDVEQFETNLRALGYTGFTVDEDYTDATAAAVKRWQRDLGLPETGVVELGRVHYAPGPIRIAAHRATTGAVAEGPLLTFTGTKRLVTALLPARSERLAAAGAQVSVELPGGAAAGGTVVSAAPPPAEETAGAQEPMLAVTVAAEEDGAFDVPGDGAVRVGFVAQRREDVLAVPVTALLALAEGGYGLQVVDGAATRVVPVTTGLFADGQVEVSGPDVREGMTVGTAR